MRSIATVFCWGILLAAASSVSSADPKPVDPSKLPGPPGDYMKEPRAMEGMPRRFYANFEPTTELPPGVPRLVAPDDAPSPPGSDRPHGAAAFEPTDPAAWKVVQQGSNHVYALTKRTSDYDPPYRSPYNIALIKDFEAGSVVIDVWMQSAMTDYPHRSLCLFFNYEDPAHFYYVHFGQRADPHANQIFIVNEAARKAISDTTTEGTPWDDQWHHGRVVRDAESGKIAVYFDDMSKPVMTATDKTFTSGQVGIGSFDDAGNFDNLRVYAE